MKNPNFLQAVYGVIPFASVPGGKLAKIKALCSQDIPVNFEPRDNLDPELLDTMKACLEKDPIKRLSAEELLVHPYLKPNHIISNSVCSSCRVVRRMRARIASKRLQNSANGFLC